MKIFQLSNRVNVMHSSWKSNFKMIPNFFLSLVCSETNRKPTNFCLITLREVFPKIISLMFLSVPLKLNQALLGRNRDVKSLAQVWLLQTGEMIDTSWQREERLSVGPLMFGIAEERKMEQERVEKVKFYWRRKEWIRIKAKVGNRLTFGPC